MKSCLLSLCLVIVTALGIKAQNVGIDVVTPVTKLDVYGEIRIGQHTTDSAGRIRYNPADKVFEGHDSLSWTLLHTRWTRASGNDIYRPLGHVGINYPDCNGQLGIKSGNTSIPNIEIKRDQVGSVLKATDLNYSATPFLIELQRLTADHAFARFAISTTWNNQLTIQRSGKIGFGTDNPGNYTGMESALVEFADNDPNHSDWALRLASSTSAACASIYFAKSGGTIDAPTIITNGHRLGGFVFNGYDGEKFLPAGAIRSEVDGAVSGVDDIPANIIFETRPGGTSSANTERMRITNRGFVGIGTSTPAGILDVRGGTATSGNGTHVYFYAQNGYDGWSANTNGGNIILYPGISNGTGTPGRLGIYTTSPGSTLHTNGSVTTAVTTITGSYTCTSSDFTIIVNTTKTITINLPAASGCEGRIYYIKKIANSTNTVTIDPYSNEKIENSSTYTALNARWEAAVIQCFNGGWYVTSTK